MTVRPLPVETVGDGPLVVLVHGFTQNRRCWGPLAPLLARRHRVVLVDLPGHGDAAHVEADLWQTADMLADTLTTHHPPPHAATRPGAVPWVGYSLGGRSCLHLALAHPEAVSRLVLIGATAGIDDPALRNERVARDVHLAQTIEAGGVASFLTGWLDQPLFSGLPAWAHFKAERSTNTPAGLAGSLRRCGTGTQEPLWSRLPSITCPVLVVVGERDHKFRTLGERLVAGLGGVARLEVIPQAGHAAHLEAPDTTAAIIGAFLAESP